MTTSPGVGGRNTTRGKRGARVMELETRETAHSPTEIATFCTCQYLWHWQYQQKIEPIANDSPKALIGTYAHLRARSDSLKPAVKAFMRLYPNTDVDMTSVCQIEALVSGGALVPQTEEQPNTICEAKVLRENFPIYGIIDKLNLDSKSEFVLSAADYKFTDTRGIHNYKPEIMAFDIQAACYYHLLRTPVTFHIFARPLSEPRKGEPEDLWLARLIAEVTDNWDKFYYKVNIKPRFALGHLLSIVRSINSFGSKTPQRNLAACKGQWGKICSFHPLCFPTGSIRSAIEHDFKPRVIPRDECTDGPLIILDKNTQRILKWTTRRTRPRTRKK